MHNLDIIYLLTGCLGAALVFGWLTERLGLSTLVGFLLAGIAVGPFTPGFVANADAAQQLAEIGVILLMFEVGLHFHPKDLLGVWRISVPGALIQSLGAMVFGWAIARWSFGWPDLSAWIFGMTLSVASTVVLIRMLDEQGRLNKPEGTVVVGWLIVEDLLTILALVVLPVLAGPDDQGLLVPIGIAIAKVSAMALGLWMIGPFVLRRMLTRLEKTNSSELFTLAIFVIALGVALIAVHWFHASPALGAFLGGLVVAQFDQGREAAKNLKPFADVFTAIFFVSIGMMFDPAFLLREPLMVVATLAGVIVVKPALAFVVAKIFGGSPSTTAVASVALAQIGEFSFMLAMLAVAFKLLPPEALSLLAATAILSIAANPLLFRLVPGLERRLGCADQPSSVATPPA